MRRELQQTKEELASTKEKLASTEQELDRTKQELRGKNLGSMDKEALVKLVLCPITGSLMEDLLIASDGHSYERDAIQKWIRQQGADAKSPKAGPLAHHNLTPNHTLRQSIEEEIERRIKEKRRQEKECKTQQEGSSSGKRKR